MDRWAWAGRIDWERTVALIAAGAAALAKPVQWVFRARRDARDAEDATMAGGWRRLGRLQAQLVKELRAEIEGLRASQERLLAAVQTLLDDKARVITELQAARLEIAALKAEVGRLAGIEEEVERLRGRLRELEAAA